MTEPKYVEVVRELLDNGADVNKANKVRVYDVIFMGGKLTVNPCMKGGCK